MMTYIIYILHQILLGQEMHKNCTRVTGRKKPLGRHMSRWNDNIKMDLEEIGYENVD
jgi:hypothetical protein